MASELRVNTLKDASGNNSVALTYVAEGTIKQWVVPNQSYAIQDSLNTSSITDSGGSVPNDSVVSLTTSFATVNYVTAGAADDASNVPRLFGRDSTATGSYGVDVYRVDALSSATSNVATTLAIGDLA
jgi:hypothetical protein